MVADMVVFNFLLAAIALGYLALGTVQAFAIAAGLQHRGFRRWQAGIMAVLVAYFPFIGGVAAVRNAELGWGWTARGGVIRFFGPLLAIAAVILFG